MSLGRREAAVVAFFLLLSCAITWPSIVQLRTIVPDPGDPLLNAWIIDWDCYAVTHSPAHLFDAPIYYPAKYPLAFSENLLGIALIGLPFFLLGCSAVTTYNILVLIGFAHAGYCAYLLGRVTTRRLIPSVIAGIFFAFTSFKFDHLAHIQIIWSGWLPLLIAALIVFWRKQTFARAALVGVAFLMNGLTNIYFLLFASVAVVLTIALLAIAQWNLRALAGSVAALAVASALLLPVLLPYRAISRQYGARRTADEVRPGSATWDDWLRVTSRNRLYGSIADRWVGRAERQLFPGALAIGLTLYAFLTLPRRGRTAGSRGSVPRWLLPTIDTIIFVTLFLTWAGVVTKKWVVKPFGRTLIDIDNATWASIIVILLIVIRLTIRLPRAFGGSDGRTLGDALRGSRFNLALWSGALWILIGILGSFGLNAFFHTFLYKQFEAFGGIRAAARWAIIAYAGFVPWIAAGAAELIERRRRLSSRHVVAAVLVVAALTDVWPVVQWMQASVDAPPFYRWMNRERVGPFLELPMHNDAYVEFYYVLYSTLHHVKELNGTSGWEPPMHERLRWRTESNRMNEGFTRTIERYGTKLVVVHLDELGPQYKVTMQWIQTAIAAGRLQFVRRFDNGISGDYVFAVKRNLTEWPRYVDNITDAAGFQQDESFHRMLRGEKTYNSSVFGRLDDLKPYDNRRGPLNVSGWALSRYGIERVTVLLHHASHRYDAQFFARPDVKAAFPWYANVPQPGFIVRFPKRPKGVPRETDIQIEIADRAGRVTRLTDYTLYWD